MKSTSLKHAFDECIGTKTLLKHADSCRFLNWVREPEKRKRIHVFPALLTLLLIVGVGITGLVLIMGNTETELNPAVDPIPAVDPDPVIIPTEEEDVQPEETTVVEEPTLEEIFLENPKYEALYQELIDGFNKLAHYRDSKQAYAEVIIFYLHAVSTGNEGLIKKYLSPMFSSDYEEQLWFEKNLPFYSEVKDYDVEVMHISPSLGEPVVSIQIVYTSSGVTESRLYHLDLQNPEHDQYMTIWESHDTYNDDDAFWRTIRWNAQIGLTKELAIELFGEPTLKGSVKGEEVWLFDEVSSGSDYTPSLVSVAADAIRNQSVLYQLYFTFEDDQVTKYALYSRLEDGNVKEYIRNSDHEIQEGIYEE